jgi:N-acetyl-gamma-glutamylphosphate reductase
MWLASRLVDHGFEIEDRRFSVIRVGIVGGTGYTGVELLRLLATHSKVEVTVITSRAEAGRKVTKLFPNLRGHYDLEFSMPSVAESVEWLLTKILSTQRENNSYCCKDVDTGIIFYTFLYRYS